MWRCPKCETYNTTEVCRVCKTKRPKMNSVSSEPDMPYQQAQPSKNKGLLIALIAIGSVLLILVTAFVVYNVFYKGGADTEAESAKVSAVEPVETPAASVEEENSKEVYYINKFSDSGIYVRSGPGKNYDKILHIKKGDQTSKLKYLGETTKGEDNWFWYKVETPKGKTGYVREDVVVLAE